ncbi:class I SAM-dependent methyltransferase [Tenacibaculum singaporense]|uniref:class I SAM-dependent methyltransferase n=1 Tax=Tenacibaculum singaporense TaxID=2358479 RepID=UPI000F69204D|nr:class I SAM-dependent methyltransferase [Tenacibaculum singaporense]RSC93655.1 class I SAM-dependent methyltransferase [Tenacibaculum singaporense]
MIKYDKIGNNYNSTRKADKKLTENLIRLLSPSKEGVYLDIGCGTGNYTHEIQKRGFQFIGIDPSETMLKEAKEKNKNITWKIGIAEKTSLPKNSVDGIIGTLTIHHWNNLNLGFQELYSVLRNKGKVVIFTSTPIQMKGYWLNHYFPKMLADSIAQMPPLESIKSAMSNAGFTNTKTENYFIEPNIEDKFLYCGKHNPELYFDEQIRHGISSFSSLANKEEVVMGLSKVREDIDSGKIKDVMKSYENNLGDYLYVVAEKQ